jgi:putative membrane protein
MVGLVKASKLFTEADRDTVKQAIVQAEQNTSGEIVPIISSASGRYDRAEDIFGLIFSLLCIAIGWVLFHNNAPTDDWDSFNFGLTAILLTIFLSFIIGVLLTHLFPVLRLPFISNKEMEEEVDRAAAAAFQHNRLRNTEDSTGILIYISLHEHRVKVLGDDGINAKLTQSDWQHICDAIITNFKDKKYTNGIVEGINLSGKLLAEHFPIKEGDKDELANELVIIDSV